MQKTPASVGFVGFAPPADETVSPGVPFVVKHSRNLWRPQLSPACVQSELTEHPRNVSILQNCSSGPAAQKPSLLESAAGGAQNDPGHSEVLTHTAPVFVPEKQRGASPGEHIPSLH
jgi:hypothetical protein